MTDVEEQALKPGPTPSEPGLVFEAIKVDAEAVSLIGGNFQFILSGK